MIDSADQLAASRRGELLDQATEAMQREYREEIERMQALAEVNPNIRQDEIEHLQSVSADARGYIERARLKLDAIRVALTVE